MYLLDTSRCDDGWTINESLCHDLQTNSTVVKSVQWKTPRVSSFLTYGTILQRNKFKSNCNFLKYSSSFLPVNPLNSKWIRPFPQPLPGYPTTRHKQNKTKKYGNGQEAPDDQVSRFPGSKKVLLQLCSSAQFVWQWMWFQCNRILNWKRVILKLSMFVTYLLLNLVQFSTMCWRWHF